MIPAPPPQRFIMVRLAAALLRALALLFFFGSLVLAILFGLTVFAVTQTPAFAASFTLVQVVFALIAAILMAAVAEILLLLLAIEGHLRYIAASQSALTQAAQQPAVVAQLTTIAQNTRYTADDMLRTSKLLETLIANLRRRFP